jgi:hypothetical protein
MRNILDKFCIENPNTHLKFNNFFFSKIVPSMKKVEKYSGVRRITNDVT